MRRSCLACAVSLLLLSCLPVPYPHTALLNPTVVGQVVEDKSGAPVAGAVITLHGRTETGIIARTITDQAGRFRIEPLEESRWVSLIPLVPIDFVAGEELDVEPPPDAHTEYESVQLRTRFQSPTPYFAEDGSKHAGQVEDVGVIRLPRVQGTDAK